MAAVGTGVPSSAGSASSNAASGAGASLLSEVKRLSPRFTSPHDAVVFALHASLLQRGFKCVAFDEKAEPSDMSNSPDWNRNSDGYSFVYRHPASQLPYVMKIIKMDQMLFVHCLSKQEGKVHNLEINIADYVRTDAPLTEYDKLYKDLDTLQSLFEQAVSFKLVPQSKPEKPPEFAVQPPVVRPFANDPLRDDRFPRRPDPTIGGPYGFPGRPSGDFDDDLNPFPPGLGGMGPGRGGMFPGGGGGLMGPNHPGFGPVGGRGVPQQPGRGRGLPRPRFDPYGPLGINDPDPDHQQPPGGPPPNWYM